MSQNKTFDPDASKILDEEDTSRFYQRSSVVDSKRTYVPDMYREMSREMEEDEPVASPKEEDKRTLVGVLFSISKQPSGELFPIYLGKNTIGNDPACDVCLKEETVSLNHAMLLVRVQEQGDSDYIVYLTDNTSSYGTKLNGVALGYEKQECTDHDILTIGENYQLMLCLFDVKKYNLSVASNFSGMNEDANSKLNGKELVEMEDEEDFYIPSKMSNGNHATNKTILM
jgi:hypothetical protein